MCIYSSIYTHTHTYAFTYIYAHIYIHMLAYRQSYEVENLLVTWIQTSVHTSLHGTDPNARPDYKRMYRRLVTLLNEMVDLISRDNIILDQLILQYNKIVQRHDILQVSQRIVFIIMEANLLSLNNSSLFSFVNIVVNAKSFGLSR